MKDTTNTAVTDEGGVVTYTDGSKGEFQYSGTVTTVIASLATILEKERKMRTTTGDRLRRMYTCGSDVIPHGLNGTPATSTASTAMSVEFMYLVRAVVPKYDSVLSDTDPHIAALDMPRYAPVGAFSVAHPTPMPGVQLDRAIGILEWVGDYTKANNIASKIVPTGDAVCSINADNATFWGKKH